MAATALPRSLGATAKAILAGQPVESALAAGRAVILAGGFDSVDYIALCDAVSLKMLATLDRPARLLAAARIGGVRLIDNIAVNP